MIKKSYSIFATLFSIFLLVVVITIGVSAVYGVTTFSNFIYDIERDDLIEKSELLLALLPIDKFDNLNEIESFTNSGKGRLTRITIIDTDGLVLADSISDSETMDNHISRPEIVANLRGDSEVVLRYSNTLNEMLIYYSLPVKKNDKLIGFLRTAISVEPIKNRIKIVTLTILFISVVLLFVSIVICYLVAIKFSHSVNSIKKVAEYYAKGDFNNKLSEFGPKELSSLSKSINQMGKSLQDRIFTINKQKNRYKSMLESMKELVIRVNMNLKVEEINSSAEKFFSIKTGGAIGLDLITATKNSELNSFVEKSLLGKDRTQIIIEFSGEMTCHLQVNGSILFDGDGKKLGILLVMNDLTEHIRLEDMRKEFVANVSHELRTPATAIQGYVETILNNNVNEEQIQKFLGIIFSHSNRLNSIIDDLLVLAGLEKNNLNFNFELFPVADLISSVINVVSVKAEKRDIKIEVDSSDKHLIYAHPILSEQALTNLVTNAIKYSNSSSKIVIKTVKGRYGTSIYVTDQGCGIPLESQKQIFERFYRVDKARSRDQGGTGLGLSIVKRVMNIHGGEASLESSGKDGSTFMLYFPGKYK
ncbi:MAG: PAS domain S-box protein [Spirochaetales bacterium]|nr:PAS domain S-box protein [Spirochaetales bacterium]